VAVACLLVPCGRFHIIFVYYNILQQKRCNSKHRFLIFTVAKMSYPVMPINFFGKRTGTQMSNRPMSSQHLAILLHFCHVTHVIRSEDMLVIFAYHLLFSTLRLSAFKQILKLLCTNAILDIINACTNIT